MKTVKFMSPNSYAIMLLGLETGNGFFSEASETETDLRENLIPTTQTHTLPSLAKQVLENSAKTFHMYLARHFLLCVREGMGEGEETSVFRWCF